MCLSRQVSHVIQQQRTFTLPLISTLALYLHLLHCILQSKKAEKPCLPEVAQCRSKPRLGSTPYIKAEVKEQMATVRIEFTRLSL